MKYIFYISVGLAVVALFYFGVSNRGELQPSQEQQLQPAQGVQSVNRTRSNGETKTDAQGAVTVTVTPVAFGKDAAPWTFNIVFDTHSGSLDDDVLAAVSLVDDRGNVYQPLAWEGLDPGGHHREGLLVFEALDSMLESVELKIKNIGNIPERTFMWNIN